MMRRRMSIAGAVASALIAGHVATAHPVHVQAGTVTLADRRVTVQFPISPKQAEHFGTTTGAIADELQRSLYIFDEFGRQIATDDVQRLVMPQSGLTMLRISYVPDEQAGHLTFQQRISADSTSHHRQLQLSITHLDHSAVKPRIIRLSSHGNAVTIDTAVGSSAAASQGFDPYHEPLLLLRPSVKAASLELHIPAPLMETWLPVAREHPDALSANDLRSLAPTLRRWFQQRFAVEDADSVALTIRTITMLRPGEQMTEQPAGHDRRDADIGFWCARLVVVAAIETSSVESRASLRCDAFNSAVLTLPVALVDDESTMTFLAPLTTYCPSMSLPGLTESRSDGAVPAATTNQ